MIQVAPLKQTDPRWASKKLGTSSDAIGAKGCALTVVTMLINATHGTKLTPDVLNDQLKKAGGFALKNLIVWSVVTKLYPKLKWKERYHNYLNFPVFVSVLKGVPVPVEVNAARIGAPRHWVLFIGDRKMIDPIDGKIKPTSTYPLTGVALYST